MIRTLLLAVTLLVAACAAPTPVEPSQPFVGVDGRALVTAGIIDNSVQEALTASPDACSKAGGSLQPVCRMGKPMCLITFKDAGKACSDSAECGSGRCYTATMTAASGQSATGACAPTNDPCGCHQRVVKGIAQPGLCAD